MTIYKSDTLEFLHYDNCGYFIEVDISDPYNSKQRHTWIKQNGTHKQEPWIKSGKTTAEDLIRMGYSVA